MLQTNKDQLLMRVCKRVCVHYKTNHDQIMLAASSMDCSIIEAFCPFNCAKNLCGLSTDLLKSFLLLAVQSVPVGGERLVPMQMKVSPIFPLKFRTKALCKAMFQRTLT